MSKDCLEGEGCSPVISIARNFAEFSAMIKTSMENHNNVSTKFWDGYKTELTEITLQFKECLEEAVATNLRLNDGGHMISKNKEDIQSLALKQRNHVFGKYGVHTFINIILVTIIMWLSSITVLLAITHPQFINAAAKLLGIN